MSRKRKVITLNDPRALRALAHPARQTLVRALFEGRQVLTATEAAELVDLSPSAVSHHLRALQKWGLAERAEGSGDGRERPWKAAGDTLDLDSAGIEGGTVALRSILGGLLEDFGKEVSAFLDAPADPWRDSYRGFARAVLWLTEEETRELTGRLTDTLDAFDRERTQSDRPAGSRKTAVTTSVLPLEPPPPTGPVDERA